MQKSPFTVLMEGEAIALALDQSEPLHSTDLSKIGQRMGFVSLDELRDPA